MNKRLRFSVMMFLQYMIWGAWYPDYGAYLGRAADKGGLGFSNDEIGWVYALLPIGCMIAPMLGGHLADRYIATEKLLGILHLAGGVTLFWLAGQTTFGTLMPLLLLWALLYAPTLALTNSICFHHMPEAEKEFGQVRVWGTIGWIVVGLLLTMVFRQTFPGFLGQLGGADSMWLGGAVSIALGIYCFRLPHTPPAQKGSDPFAFLAALKMLRDPQFALFIAISFVVATELMFYFVFTAPFLEASKMVAVGQAPLWMTIAQAAEIGTMFALPWMLSKWGVRKTMAVGILAWPIRYAIFALGNPAWLVLAALSLHGLCYVCFFTVAYIYVNQVAEPDMRASAQGLITFVTLGVGMALGSKFAAWITGMFTDPQTKAVDYKWVFIVPLVLTVLCAIVFMLFFREGKWKSQPATA
ncbi:MAG: MFS transporter [Blastocatellia bacterium]